MLTDSAKQHTTVDSMQTFFRPAAGTQQAYEIGRGKKLRDGRYEFPLTVFEIAAGGDNKRIHPRYSKIIVTRAGKEDWAIDKLP